MGLRPPMRMKMVRFSEPLSPNHTLYFVISTGAQRSGEISVWMPLLGMFFDGAKATCPGVPWEGSAVPRTLLEMVFLFFT